MFVVVFPLRWFRSIEDDFKDFFTIISSAFSVL